LISQTQSTNKEKNIEPLKEKTVSSLFAIMAFCAVLPLYFEDTRQLCGLLFISLMGYLFVSKRKPLNYQISEVEWKWMAVSVIYASVFIISYLVRELHTDDGSWRIAAPGFILLLTAWYYLAARWNKADSLIYFVAISSLIAASVLFIWEASIAGLFSQFRFGAIVGDLGAVGFLVPITAILFAVLWLKNRQMHYLMALIVMLVLSIWNGSRTSLVIVVLPLLVVFFYIFWSSKENTQLNRYSKMAVSMVLLIAVGLALWMTQGRLYEIYLNYQSALNGDYYSSMGLRYVMNEVGFKLAITAPWLGVGPSEYKIALGQLLQQMEYPGLIKESIMGFMQLHNQYLMDWVMSGLAGLISLIMFMFYGIFVLLKHRTAENLLISIVAASGLIGVTIIQFFGANFTYTYNTIFYVLAVSSLIGFVFSKRSLKS